MNLIIEVGTETHSIYPLSAEQSTSPDSTLQIGTRQGTFCFRGTFGGILVFHHK